MSRYFFRNKHKPVYNENLLGNEIDEQINSHDPPIEEEEEEYTPLNTNRKRNHSQLSIKSTSETEHELSQPPHKKRKEDNEQNMDDDEHTNTDDNPCEEKERSLKAQFTADMMYGVDGYRRRSLRLRKKTNIQSNEEMTDDEQNTIVTNQASSHVSNAEDSDYEQEDEEQMEEEDEEHEVKEDDISFEFEDDGRRRSQRLKNNNHQRKFFDHPYLSSTYVVKDDSSAISLPIALRRSRRVKRRPKQWSNYVNIEKYLRRKKGLRPLNYNESSDESVMNMNTNTSNSNGHRYNLRQRRNTFISYESESSSGSGSVFMSDNEMHMRNKQRISEQRADIQPINQKRKKASNADISPMMIDLDIDWNSVGGLELHIQKLKEMVILPLLYPQEFAQFRMSPSKGVLFHGPPGTGKTLVARVLAAQCSRYGQKVSFYMRKGADCLSKWVGEAERQLRLLFEEAAKNQPSIIFFDEVDGLAPVRSARQDQIHSSIVSTLLALMDGLDSRGQIIVIGATNRPDHIDPALRRPGRFDLELCFQLPSRNARKQILKIHTKTWEPPMTECLAGYLADKTAGYCGADIEGLCREAFLTAVRRTFPQIYHSNTRLQINAGKLVVGEQDFEHALIDITPSAQRSTLVHSRTIQPLLKPLLDPHLNVIRNDIQCVFNISRDETHHTSVTTDISLWSEQKRKLELKRELCARHYRYLIHGSDIRYGQTQLGCAVLHVLEEYTLYSLDLPSMMGDTNTKCPEESCLEIFKEAKRNAPSVIYWPHVDRWWTTASSTLKSCLSLLLDDIPHEIPIFMLATSDIAMEDLDPLLQSLFNNYHCFDCNQKIPVDIRKRYWLQLKTHYLRYSQIVSGNGMNEETDDIKDDVNDDEMAVVQLRSNIRSVCNRLRREFVSIWDKCQMDDGMESDVSLMNIPLQLLFDIRKENDNREYPTVQLFLNDIQMFVDTIKDKSCFNDIYDNNVHYIEFVCNICQLHDDALLMISNINQDLVRYCAQYAMEHEMEHMNISDNSSSVHSNNNQNTSPLQSPRRSVRLFDKNDHVQGKHELNDEFITDNVNVNENDINVHFDDKRLMDIINNLVRISAEFTIDEFEEKLRSLIYVLFQFNDNYDQMVQELEDYVRMYIRDPEK